MENTEKPWLWKPGQSGNPLGKPKGILSIKSRIRNYLLDNPGEVERLVHYFIKKKPALMWQMLEGRPQQNVDLGVDKDSISELTNLFRTMAGVTQKIDDIQGPEGSDGIRSSEEAVSE
jgi:hypothetical protein